MKSNTFKPSRLTAYIESVPSSIKWYLVAYVIGGGLLLNLCGAMSGCLGFVAIGLCSTVWPLSFAFPMFMAALAEETSHATKQVRPVPSVLVTAWTTIRRTRWLIAGYIILVVMLAISYGLQPDWWDSARGSGGLLPDELSSDQYRANFGFWALLSIGLVGLVVVGILAGIWAGLTEEGLKMGWLSPVIVFAGIAILNGVLLFGWSSKEGDPLIWPEVAYILIDYCLLPIILASVLFYGASRYSIFRLRRASPVIPTSSSNNPDS